MSPLGIYMYQVIPGINDHVYNDQITIAQNKLQPNNQSSNT